MNPDMNHLDPAFDPRIADWLEADPDRAPHEVLDTILAAMPSIPQRRAHRAPRRLSDMNRFALLGVAAAIVVAIGFGGLVLTRGPNAGRDVAAPSPSPSLSPLTLTKQLNSGRHGYSIRYPDGWRPSLASAVWFPGTATLWGDPALDVIQSPTARLVAASQALSDGQTADAWYRAYCAGFGPAADTCRSYAKTWRLTQIGGQPGYVDLDGVSAAGGTIKPGGPIFDAVTVVNGRGYAFTLDGDVDRSTFEQLLGGVTFKTATPTPLDHVSAIWTSPLYGYSIRVDPTWTTNPATVPPDDPSVINGNGVPYDEIKVSGTDTTIQGDASDLAGKTFADFLAAKHQEALDDPGLPGNCRGSEVAKWPEVPIGDATGRQMTLCNYAEFYVEAHGKAYDFNWAQDTFDTTEHLDMGDFKNLLRTVRFPGS